MCGTLAALFLKCASKISQSSGFISSSLQHRFNCLVFYNKSSHFFLSLLSMSRSPLNTKRRSRKKRRKTRRRRRRRRSSITTSTTTATEVRRSRCRTARWRRKSPCRSVGSLRLAACAAAHVSAAPRPLSHQLLSLSAHVELPAAR